MVNFLFVNVQLFICIALDFFGALALVSIENLRFVEVGLLRGRKRGGVEDRLVEERKKNGVIYNHLRLLL